MQLDKQKQFLNIIQLIKNVQNNAVIAVNAELVNLYWKVGKYINKQLASPAWCDKTVGELASFIQKKYREIKDFNRRGLYRMKQFYETYSSMSFVPLPMKQFDNIKDTILAK